MNHGNLVKVLLVPDVIWGDNSGAVSARFTASILYKLGYDVTVYAFSPVNPCREQQNENIFRFIPRCPSSSIHHFLGGKVKVEFEGVLTDCMPDYVFFAGVGVGKPYHFYDACFRLNIPFNLLFYINDYYCSRIYAGLADGPCFRCINGNYLHAYVNGCLNGRPRMVHFMKSALVLTRLKEIFRKCHKVIGYSDDQLSLYRRYGFAPEQCIKSPVQFNNECIKGVEPRMGDYFVLCGQSSVEKGWHYMADVVRLCPGVRFAFVFPNVAIAESQLACFGLQEFVSNGQIEIVTGLKEHDDLMKLLAGARGVLIPSNYPTTGEFVMMESLGLGKPVIVFDAGIHPDIIRSGENGLMAKIGDVGEFARHINCLNADDDLYGRLANGARSLFEELNSSERLAEAVRLALPPCTASVKYGER